MKDDNQPPVTAMDHKDDAQKITSEKPVAESQEIDLTGMTRRRQKRRLLIIMAGFACLIAITLLGTSLESLLPHHASSPIQTLKAGPYQITIHLTPDPLRTSQPADVIIQIINQEKQQLLTEARVTLASHMLDMDMGTEQVIAQLQPDNNYYTQLHFPMAGTWRIHLTITPDKGDRASTDFDVSVQ